MIDVTLAALPMEIAVLSQQGTILHISSAWQAFASAFGMPSLARASVGMHYRTVAEQAALEEIDGVREVQEGIAAVLARSLPVYTRLYSHHDLKETHEGVEPFWFLLYVARFVTQASQVVVGHLNLTGQKLLETQTVSANQEMSEFLSHFSHEARTPLASFDAYVQLARRRLQRIREQVDQGGLTGEALDQGLAEVQETMEQAQASSRRLNRLIEDLAEVAQIQSGHLTLHRVPCDLVEIVKKSIAEQTVSWPERQFTLGIHTRAVSIVADPDRIGEVVTNYLTNALKYAPPDRPIHISVSAKAGQARVQVRDQGPGIVRTEQVRIWQRFYRSPNAPEPAGAGLSLGMGLFICRSIIAEHGGQTGVKSTPGKGATFWFIVPLLLTD